MFEKKWIWPVIVAVGICTVAMLLGTKLILALSLGVIFGVGVAAQMIANSRGEKVEDVVEEVIQQVVKPDPDALKRKVENQLVILNEHIRLDCQHEDVITSSELVIDLLFEVVPRALKEAPGSESTYNLEKMATDHLPELFRDFLVLSKEDQISEMEALVSQLSVLEGVVNKAKDALDSGNMDTFEISSTFISAKTA